MEDPLHDESIVLKTSEGSARIARLGAQVLSYCPAGQAEVLWTTPTPAVGKPLRGGIPLCFPWFGAWAGHPSAPAHGFARTRVWALEEVQPARAVFVLRDDETTRASWPHAFEARLTIALEGGLQTTLTVHNCGDAPLVFEAALHGYLSVGDVRQIRTFGLAGSTYLDKTDGSTKVRSSDPLVLTAETDAVHADTTSALHLDDPVLGRRLSVHKEGSRSTVVWNPWAAKAAAMPDVGDAWTAFLCIETANVGSDAIALAPGATHAMRQVLARPEQPWG